MVQRKIVVIDDEINICKSVSACLKPEGYDVLFFTSASAAIKAMHSHYFDLAIIDIRLGQENGIDLYQQMIQEQVDLPTIFISGNASLDEAARTLKLGAYDFLEKPFNAEKLIVTVNNCIAFQQMRLKVNAIEQAQDEQILIGEHQLIKSLKTKIKKVANNNVNVLITGESGTGKELIAQAIHDSSPRASQSIVKVNCSAIPESLFESALFGHIKGAFTGADKHKKGYFEMADQGTLFLDEIADIPLSAQATLLRALENKEIQKVGSEQVSKVDIRLLAASHKDLKTLVEVGQFREDLYYRLSVIPIHSPSLRARQTDIPLLANYFIYQICQRHGLKNKTIESSCLSMLTHYHWPGNVRELHNAIERMLIMGGETLNNSDLPSEIMYSTSQSPVSNEQLTLKEHLRHVERELIIERLREYRGNITKVAASLALDRSYLHKKLTHHAIKRDHNFE
jgi:two-component system nitrogen regulation response regulator NtrX